MRKRFGLRDAKVIHTPEELLLALEIQDVSMPPAKIEAPAEKKPVLTVIPGKSSTKGQTLPFRAALYIVCPSRPALAGEIAAKLAKETKGALVCAAPESTGALAMGVKPEELVDADWRIPGSSSPIEKENIKI